MTQDKEILGTAPIGKLLFKLAIPTIIAQLINMLYNIIDRIFIGHMPENGSLALTGVGVCLPIILIVSAFSAFAGAGGAPKASILLGEKKEDQAAKVLGGCFTLQVVISIILTTVLLIWGEDILMVFGASEETLPYASSYLKIYAIGTIFVQLTLGMNAFITAQGFTLTSMFAVLIGALFNIALDPLFIYAFHMGVKGAALATIISQSLSTIWVIVFLCSKKSFLRLSFKNFFVNPKIILPCIALGMATFIMQASESIILTCFNVSLLKYGGNIAVGAMTILSTISQFALLPLMGIGQGAQPITSYNYGAKKPERVKKTFKLLLLVSLIYSVSLYILVEAFPGLFVKIFTNDPKLQEFAKLPLRVYYAGMIFFGAQMACQATFVATGNSISSIVVASVRKFGLLLPFIYIMPAIMKDNQTMAVYLAEPISDAIAVTFTVILFAIQFKKSLKKIEPKVDEEYIEIEETK